MAVTQPYYCYAPTYCNERAHTCCLIDWKSLLIGTFLSFFHFNLMHDLKTVVWKGGAKLGRCSLSLSLALSLGRPACLRLPTAFVRLCAQQWCKGIALLQSEFIMQCASLFVPLGMNIFHARGKPWPANGPWNVSHYLALERNIFLWIISKTKIVSDVVLNS